MGSVMRKLSPRLSAALDVARSLAATYVVVHHVASARGWSHGLGLIFRFGQEAVLVFFLLSGFVIFANERERALKPSGYYWRRLRRIYPGLIIAMLVSTFVSLDNGDFLSRFKLSELLYTLLSLQDVGFLKPGVISNPYLGNDPLWSLSYEVVFYLVFPAVLIAWSRNAARTGMIVGVVSCLSYVLFVAWPNHASLVATYFLIWWCGAMAGDAYLRGESNFKAFSPSLCWLSILCGISAVAVEIVGYKGFGYYPFLQLRHFAIALTMLVAFSTPLGAIIARWCLPLARPAAFWASISYGLYVLHYPILVDWKRAQTLPGFALALLILCSLAYLVDRKLNAWLPRAPRD